MKKNILILVMPFLICINFSSVLNAQKINAKAHKLFSLHNAKFSMGFGLEASLSSFYVNLTTPTDIKVANKNPSADSSIFGYTSGGLSFDFYSPNSILGLNFGVNYASSNLSVKVEQDSYHATYDFFNMRRLEFPVSLRIRPGKIDGKEHSWILVGGVFNYPISGYRKQYLSDYYTLNYNGIDKSKDQFKPYVSAACSFGYEIFMGQKRNSRLVIYVDADYPLSNCLNTDYIEFKAGGNSPLSNYDFKIRQIRIGVGLKYYQGFRKHKQ